LGMTRAAAGVAELPWDKVILYLAKVSVRVQLQHEQLPPRRLTAILHTTGLLQFLFQLLFATAEHHDRLLF